MEISTYSPEATQEAGRKLSADPAFAGGLKGGEVIALTGELGAGKTHFIQGLAEGLGIESRIISPTFIIMREYETPKNKFFYHVDLYRIEENISDNLKGLGLTDIWGKRENIVAIEWADRAVGHLPENTIWVRFQQSGLKKRKIRIVR